MERRRAQLRTQVYISTSIHRYPQRRDSNTPRANAVDRKVLVGHLQAAGRASCLAAPLRAMIDDLAAMLGCVDGY